MANRKDNLKPFKPGQSGNPGGRPKGSCSVAAIIRQLLTDEETATKLAKAILSQAARGNGAAIKQVLDRTDGPVQQKVDFLFESKATIRAMLAAAIPYMTKQTYDAWSADARARLLAIGETLEFSGPLPESVRFADGSETDLVRP